MEKCSEPAATTAESRPGRDRAGELPGGLVVRKYGGSSLATPDRVRNVAGALAALAAEGRRVVVVVSAMGDTTDELVALAGEFADRPEARELDQLMATGEQASAALLALAVNQLGVRAGSLSGDQAGIVVGGRPGAGVIERIDAHRIFERLRHWRVVVVAGFQGRNRDGELLTLGRGGSDTTAVALAAALGSTDCEICTDVAGVHTADPRVVPGSRRLDTVPYDVMTELAGRGAKVLHPRSVALAARHEVRVRVLHSMWPVDGTTVAEEPLEAGHRVVGIAHERDVRLVSLTLTGARAARCAPALAKLVEHGLNPDVLTWRDRHEVRFTVRGQAPLDVLDEVARELDAKWVVEDDLGAVSVVGVGLFDHPGYLAGMLRAVGALGVAVAALATSPSRFTAVLPVDLLDAAVCALHETFGLGAGR
ncbi:aspartate kinase [Saccharothrix tamanrassetensis]|uniref:Aspartokinase n=1 Tax=Saccharothrix tamanrassetensis TaxID=1051531 RepID=A0A841CRL4_9PSEU|nr:aspartate kinase [Saccharothrix tamanrassetensis]MBB5960381.1 aspartate kinase [Saccharothrix tamanrassetensis]